MNYLITLDILILIVALKAHVGMMQLVQYAMFLMSSLAQILLMCWYGNKLIDSVR